MSFRLLSQDSSTRARRGVLATPHGTVQTPVFMPVGTQGTVKAMTPRELTELGTQVLLGNTYHLFIRPGLEIIRQAGGLHRFMAWDGPILTDSGGYQVFSLSALRQISDHGVSFRSHLDGAPLFLGPVEAMAIQRTLGSDVAMVFDECPPFPCARDRMAVSLERTRKWAEICRDQPRADGQQIFGIIQGGTHRDFREQATREILDIGFDGYALGGLSVGEPEADMFQVLDWVLPRLPDDRPHYLMGVGTPPQIVEAVARGVDMFDCVLPTRMARNGTAFTNKGPVPVKAGRYKDDFRPIEEGCGCYACRNFSRAYVRHLLNANEILGSRLMTLHNLHFYLELCRRIRRSIEHGEFDQFRTAFRAAYTAASGGN